MRQKKSQQKNEPANQQGLDIRTGLSTEAIKQAILDNLYYAQARVPGLATLNDWYMAVACTIRDRMLDNWTKTIKQLKRKDIRAVCYLSAEFLLGPHLANNMINLGIYKEVSRAVSELGLDMEQLIAQEEEPGLGNGGLGRLAACYMDSLSTLDIPALGYGIRYEFGIFDQTIRDGWQVETTDKWLQKGNPWEIVRPEFAYYVNAGGHTEYYTDEQGRQRVKWVPARVIKGVACDTPISGYRGTTVNMLRLWKSEAVESFDFESFNIGDYYAAVNEKVISETISKVLYPNDEPEIGKLLRLAQQYFFVLLPSDMTCIHLLRGTGIKTPQDLCCTVKRHAPSIAVAELMRLF
jgi:starch phosphorylase